MSLKDKVIEYKILEYKSKVIFEKLVVCNFNRVPKPFYEDEAFFIYLQEGSFQIRTPERVINLNTGNAILGKCGSYFLEQSKDDHDKSLKTTAIAVFLYPEIVKELFDSDFSISDFEPTLDAIKINTDFLMKNFIDGIEFLLENPSVCNESMVKIKLKEFILLLSNTENASAISDFMSSLFKPYENDFRKIINQNLYSTLTLSELAMLSSMSVSTFQREFKKLFKETPAKYILAQRMTKAKGLLIDKSKRISEIAYECGYQSTSTFNRLFKNHFNCSPSEFRLTEIEVQLN